MKQEKKGSANDESLKSKAKKLSIKEGSAFSVSEGAGMRYITPFALAINSSNSQIGLLSSIPSLLGNFSQIYSTRLMKTFSRKHIVFTGALLQAFMWLFLILLGLLFFVFNVKSYIIPILLIFIYTILTTFGSFIVPAWTSWMRDIVTKDSGIYFGKRSKICGFFVLVSMLFAGLVLDYFKNISIFWGFVVLFLAAFISRMISAFLFKKKYEPEFKFDDKYYFSFFQFIQRMVHNNFGKFVLFISIMSLATSIASPFFAVYMLKEIDFSYTMWITTVMASTLSSLLFFPILGKLIDKYGCIKMLKISGIFTPMIPFLWVISVLLIKNRFLLFFSITFIEGFSGFIWAGFNLAASNFVYDAVTRQRMVLCVAYFNFLNSIGIFIGATLGGIFASFDFSFFGLSPLLFIFLLSGLARLITYAALSHEINEVRPVKDFKVNEFKNIIALDTIRHINSIYLYLNSKLR